MTARVVRLKTQREFEDELVGRVPDIGIDDGEYHEDWQALFLWLETLDAPPVRRHRAMNWAKWAVIGYVAQASLGALSGVVWALFHIGVI